MLAELDQESRLRYTFAVTVVCHSGGGDPELLSQMLLRDPVLPDQFSEVGSDNGSDFLNGFCGHGHFR